MGDHDYRFRCGQFISRYLLSITFAQLKLNALTSSEAKTDSLSYRSHRLLLSIDVSIDNGFLNWRYRSVSGDWRERIPLSEFVPYPTITISRSSFWGAVAVASLSPIIVGYVLLWLDCYRS